MGSSSFKTAKIDFLISYYLSKCRFEENKDIYFPCIVNLWKLKLDSPYPRSLETTLLFSFFNGRRNCSIINTFIYT